MDDFANQSTFFNFCADEEPDMYGNVDENMYEVEVQGSEEESDEADFEEEESSEDNGPVVRTPIASEISTHVRSALQEKKNLLLECPPGQERQMTIVDTVLNFYRTNRGNISKIYFASIGFDGVANISRMIQENYTETPHLHDIRIAVLGPRNRLCIREVEDGSTSDNECRSLIRNHNRNQRNGANENVCEFYRNSVNELHPDRLFSFTQPSNLIGEGALLVRDIEDLVSHGREVSQCPYFDSIQHLHADANLVLCPIEFLLSPVLRHQYGVNLSNAIVIFDDGYDVEAQSYKEGSIKISKREILSGSRAFAEIVRVIQQPDLVIRDEYQIRQVLNGLIGRMQELGDYLTGAGGDDDLPSPESILDQLSSLFNLTVESINRICTGIEDVLTQPGIPESPHLDHGKITKIKKFLHVLCLSLQNSEDYTFLIKTEEGANGNPEKFLKIMCMNASVIFANAVDRSSSVIIGGDCLAPMNTLQNYLGVEFIRLSVVHEEGQRNTSYFMGYCSSGPTNQEFSLIFKERDNPEVHKEIGQSILKFCELIPNGVIILFHSKAYYNTIIGYLNRAGTNGEESLTNQISNRKTVIFEEFRPDAESDERQLQQYKAQSVLDNGAVLFCCARGSLYKKLRTERLRDKEIRGIIHISMTYDDWWDDFIVGKRKHFERPVEGNRQPDNGSHEWFINEAFRVQNQSFANCVYNNNDWGIVVVLDSRVESKRHNFQEYLPGWVNHLNRFKKLPFNTLIENMQTFINNRRLVNE